MKVENKNKREKQIERINKMEKIHSEYSKLLIEVEKVLEKFEDKQKEYSSLVQYYYSKNWSKDKNDIEKDKLPKIKSSFVLTEDAIYDSMIDNDRLAIHMLEMATKILKR
ncbi:DUF4298 domain-containing protein [Fusobacterium massiliense]|uniref:DUF4298 domain-containing protein n=1 Tax=Fusobacterium massiliense TaxID=1852365 RepID=UPI0028F0E0AB|nr:DUF4298 domain-containing protein [Fusobacterium massiliense]